MWNFSDDSTTDLLESQHAYTASGVYTATLTVTYDDGGTGTDTVMVTIEPPTFCDKPIEAYTSVIDGSANDDTLIRISGVVLVRGFGGNDHIEETEVMIT